MARPNQRGLKGHEAVRAVRATALRGGRSARPRLWGQVHGGPALVRGAARKPTEQSRCNGQKRAGLNSDIKNNSEKAFPQGSSQELYDRPKTLPIFERKKSALHVESKSFNI